MLGDARMALSSYEALCCALSGDDLALLEAAIGQAAAPYYPVPKRLVAVLWRHFVSGYPYEVPIHRRLI